MDPETTERKGMYKHPIIQKAVNVTIVMWFQNKRDEGIRYKDMLKPIPIPAIALVLTAEVRFVFRYNSVSNYSCLKLP